MHAFFTRLFSTKSDTTPHTAALTDDTEVRAATQGVTDAEEELQDAARELHDARRDQAEAKQALDKAELLTQFAERREALAARNLTGAHQDLAHAQTLATARKR